MQAVRLNLKYHTTVPQTLNKMETYVVAHNLFNVGVIQYNKSCKRAHWSYPHVTILITASVHLRINLRTFLKNQSFTLKNNL